MSKHIAATFRHVSFQGNDVACISDASALANSGPCVSHLISHQVAPPGHHRLHRGHADSNCGRFFWLCRYCVPRTVLADFCRCLFSCLVSPKNRLDCAVLWSNTSLHNKVPVKKILYLFHRWLLSKTVTRDARALWDWQHVLAHRSLTV